MSAAWVLAALAGVLGLAIGSFLNVVVHRVPAGISVVAPASACPRCDHPIRRRDNVPVLSWLLLRARCRDCAAPISARYPAVEGATAVLFVLVALVVPQPLGATTVGEALGRTVMLAALLFLMAVSVALSLIDLDTHRLPNAVVYPAAVVLLVLLGAVSAVSGDWGALLRGLLGAVVLGGAYLVLALAVPGGMGLGDVKLAVVLGLVLAYLGWGPLAVGAFGGFLVGGTVAIALVAVGRARMGSGVPFGPSMLVGAWIGIVLGAPLWSAYLGLLGLS
ncbi:MULTISPECIES: A24 family peptidase [unclassified Curtobacterium]|uniref:prepilin peptidase n=1 Tax=unclassified Curtobacterium TaxID=257496 RepID=UPI00204228B8|nr:MULTISPECIES: A24 family peptidase [unclassified Curtobacterium]MCM3505558.1 prepilin peptidase [Curtobacterium sp. ODYSSEY 48 V2]MCM3522315.1 prepilin peptidase [Curtobacterium sp. P97]MDT0209879.1 prepilin peptidase [Curtobacterium sp. BRD11]